MKRLILALVLVTLYAANVLAGEILVYTALEDDQIPRYIKSFEAQHPDITVKFVRDSTGIVTAKLNVEKDKIELVAADGRDIKIENFNNSAVDDPNVTGASMKVQGGIGDDKKGLATVLSDTNAPTTDTDSTTIGGNVELKSTGGYFSVASDKADSAGGLFSGDAKQLQAGDLKAVNSIDISTVAGATAALDIVDGALSKVNSIRADLGAVQNRFESTIANLQTSTENLSAARSRIRDTDFAAETANLTRSQILQQAGTAMLAQANALPNQVLSLLG